MITEGKWKGGNGFVKPLPKNSVKPKAPKGYK
jgi:hypothetical protein